MHEPLALEYIAASVSETHDVRILDMRIERNLKDVLEEFSPHVVGITAYTVHVNIVRRLCKEVKRFSPEVFTVVGGHHATVAPEDFISPDINLIVMGEGVFVFREAIEHLKDGKMPEGLPVTAYIKNGTFVKNPPEPVSDLDVFPFPSRALTARYRKHYFTEWLRPLASVRTSKGCPFRCSFCALWKLTGGRYLRRRPEMIVKELAEIEEEFVFFADDESLIDVKRMKELAGLIKEAGIKKKYFLYGRSDTIARHPELLELWKDIGLERVFVGLEFFRDDDLGYIRKGSTIRHNEDAIKILQSLNIEIYASFIVRPEFRRADFRQFRQYCRRMGLNFATFSVLTPLPGTDFYEEVKDRLITHNYDYFDFIHTLLPTSLPLKEFYKEMYYLYKEAIPICKSISLLKRFPLRDIPMILRRSNKILRQIRNAYKDYE
ncbi:MAG: radical SAM protein [Nitrospirae bacterium]|nr:radical SAM protein [Nitrospirota bacterium]